jgi:hypothetical protein
MFDRVSQVAEALATDMSRRRFLGSFGRWAGATALAMAGVLTTAGSARAANQNTCCRYGLITLGGDQCKCTACVPLGTSCPSVPSSCPSFSQLLPSSSTVRGCGDCKCPNGKARAKGTA